MIEVVVSRPVLNLDNKINQIWKTEEKLKMKLFLNILSCSLKNWNFLTIIFGVLK